MTQGELFQEVIGRIKPIETEREKARGRRDFALRILNNQELGIIGVRNYGSYAKRTGIRPLDDLDIIVFISPERYPKANPESILRILARDIRPSYPNNEIIPGNRFLKSDMLMVLQSILFQLFLLMIELLNQLRY